MMPRTTLAKAMLNVEHDTNGGCWLWSGAMFWHGYGSISFAGKRRLAHRFFYENIVGAIPEGMLLLHKCDVRACVNPAHLFPGTHAHNSADCVSKSRHVSIKGSASSMARLTELEVAAIRMAWANRSATQHEMAAQYGVSQSNISMIVRGKTWDVVGQVRPDVALLQIVRRLEKGGDQSSTLADVAAIAKAGLTISQPDNPSPTRATAQVNAKSVAVGEVA